MSLNIEPIVNQIQEMTGSEHDREISRLVLTLAIRRIEENPELIQVASGISEPDPRFSTKLRTAIALVLAEMDD